MKINLWLEVDIPVGLYCNKCSRQETDKNGQKFCAVFNSYLWIKRGNYLKCKKCLNALYDAINNGD